MGLGRASTALAYDLPVTYERFPLPVLGMRGEQDVHSVEHGNPFACIEIASETLDLNESAAGPVDWIGHWVCK
jgi:hypothetical protein